MANQDSQKKAYRFLVDRLVDQKEFTPADFMSATGWNKKTYVTYMSKQLKAYVRKLPGGLLRVRRTFAKFGTFAAFQPLVTQVKRPVSQYKRNTYDAVVSYEFLLPLTQEGKLRIALDELFYSDTVDALVRDLADDGALESAFAKEVGETPEAHVKRAIKKIGELFGGYSITHVDGRFRAGDMLSRREAADRLVRHERYLVDETTAIVRFIFPSVSTRRTHGERFDLVSAQTEMFRAPMEAEIKLIRGLFFSVFVDAVVASVQGEDVIWLLEDSPSGRRLYELGRAGEEIEDDAKEQEDDDE